MTIAKTIACALTASALSAGMALAAPIAFEGSFAITSIVGANTAGLSTGDAIVFTILVENGGGIAGNSWSNGDVVSAMAVSGSYVATFNAPFFDIDPIFATDAAGGLSLVAWFDNDLNNTDTAGPGSPQTTGPGLTAGDGTEYGLPPRGFDAPANWIAKDVTPVPLPAGLALLLTGLGGLAVLRRRLPGATGA
jgi:hypothetical protein